MNELFDVGYVGVFYGCKLREYVLNYQMIIIDDGLCVVCEVVSVVFVVVLDMEFVCICIYYLQLGLLQLFDGQQVFLIDFLMINDWVLMCDLLFNQDVIKYLYVGSEDLEVFFNVFNLMLQLLIDIQILVVFCGCLMFWGFVLMVEEYFGVVLDKSEFCIDWLVCLLIECQCEYVVVDVWYLLLIVSQLMVEIDCVGWLLVVFDECCVMQQCCQEVVDLVEVWCDIGNVWQLCICQLGCLQLLVEWCLCKVCECDLVVNFVVWEEYLWSVVCYMFISLGEFDSFGLFGSEICFYGKMLISLVEKVQVLLELVLLVLLQNLIDMLGYCKVFKDIKVLVQEVSMEKGVSVELLVLCWQINQLLNWYWQLKM